MGFFKDAVAKDFETTYDDIFSDESIGSQRYHNDGQKMSKANSRVCYFRCDNAPVQCELLLLADLRNRGSIVSPSGHGTFRSDIHRVSC